MPIKQTNPWKRASAMLAMTTMLSGVMPPAFAADHDFKTTTPIKHVVVIFQENASFDHYFGTYPKAVNPAGEPKFVARDDTPAVNGLFSGGLLTNNPNRDAGGNQVNPFRFTRAQAVTCSNDHDYTDEQKAFDSGLMDKFVSNPGLSCNGNTVMGYFDGNTVTALWNYAQRFAMSDNSFDTTFGPSTPGALNVISGQMHAIGTLMTKDDAAGDLKFDVFLPGSTITGDADPLFDDCGAPDQAGFAPNGAADNHNIGDLLNKKGVTWGWFQGGFKPTVAATATTPAVCGLKTTGHPGVNPGNPNDPVHALTTAYSAHHNPFMYYQHMANTHHLPPTSVAMIGRTDQANHQYDIDDFFTALDAGNLPAVSYLKAVRAQDGHPGNSDPLSEQLFLVNTINRLQQSPEWKETAVIIAWDDSDGWYDHMPSSIVNPSNSSFDALSGGNNCGTPAQGAYLGRCGYGPRLPILIVSPWAKRNFVDHSTTDQSSIVRFIEDNFSLGRIDDLDHPGGTPAGQQSFDALAGSLGNMFDFDDGPHLRRVILNPLTGQVADRDADRDDHRDRDGHRDRDDHADNR